MTKLVHPERSEMMGAFDQFERLQAALHRVVPRLSSELASLQPDPSKSGRLS